MNWCDAVTYSNHSFRIITSWLVWLYPNPSMVLPAALTTPVLTMPSLVSSPLLLFTLHLSPTHPTPLSPFQNTNYRSHVALALLEPRLQKTPDSISYFG